MIHQSPHPPVEIPDVSLPAFVLGDAAARGDRPALIDGPTGRTITYAELVGARARRGRARGARVRSGHTFAIFAPNLPEYAVAFHGVAIAGGTVTTINSLASESDLTEQLAATQARFLLTVERFCDRALPAARAAGVEEVFVAGRGG